MSIPRRTFLGAAAVTLTVAGCARDTTPTPRVTPSTTAPLVDAPHSPTATPTPSAAPLVKPPAFEVIQRELGTKTPTAFGLELPGIVTRSDGDGVALTFDACGGPGGDKFDEALITTLRKHKVPATLFINERWARANTSLVASLGKDPLFCLANHGTIHRPLTVDGRAAYGIAGTATLEEAYQEVAGCETYLQRVLQRPVRFFRSGTAHFDDVGVALVRRMGLLPVNFDVNLDSGATLPADAVAENMRSLKPGSIGIGHFNRPGQGTADGVAQALPGLKNLRFVRLDEVL